MLSKTRVVSGEIEHHLGQLQLGDVLKVLGSFSNFEGIAQRQAQQAAVLLQSERG